jgi:glutamate--cysteine ligase catalytic subunit
MRRAHQRDGLLKHKFFFRKHLAPLRQGQASGQSHETSTAQQKTDADMAAMGFGPCAAKDENDEYEEMTIGEILNGKGDYFLGLIPLCYMYLDVIGCDKETTQRVSLYLDYIRRRGTGETMTTAAWIRKFVTGHPEYKGDSVVNEAVAYDLMMECKRIGEGKKQCPELLGPIAIDPIFAAEAYAVYLSSTKLEGSERAKLLREYQMREPFKRHRKATAPVQVEKTGKEEDDFFQ